MGLKTRLPGRRRFTGNFLPINLNILGLVSGVGFLVEIVIKEHIIADPPIQENFGIFLNLTIR
jgi:hypothetical protein